LYSPTASTNSLGCSQIAWYYLNQSGRAALTAGTKPSLRIAQRKLMQTANGSRSPFVCSSSSGLTTRHYLCPDLSIMESRGRKVIRDSASEVDGGVTPALGTAVLLSSPRDGGLHSESAYSQKGNTTYQSGQTRLAAALTHPHPIPPTGLAFSSSSSSPKNPPGILSYPLGKGNGHLPVGF